MATETVRQITTEHFNEAAALKIKAASLPRWRWVKRYRLLDRAHVLEQAATLFWNDHKDD